MTALPPSMLPLPVDAMEKVRPLFAPLDFCLVTGSILAGHTPATVYVDDVTAPRTAVTWFKSRALLAGEQPNEAACHAVAYLLRETYFPQAKTAGWEGFSLYSAPGWHEPIGAALAGHAPITARRHYYRLDARGQAWEAAVPDGLALRPVDAALLADGRMKNLAYVTEEMVSERPSIADFLEKSFGYCLIHDDEIVAWCMSEYNTGPRCELGIATAEPYQRQGLATAVGTAVIAEAVRRGVYDIGWLCWANNRPSVATALRLGFTLTADFPIHLILFATQEDS
jgi:GNAT superfamily N-acetyltransferase